MSFSNLKSIILSGCISLALLTSANAQGAPKYKVLDSFHQPASPGVEKADITVISCYGKQYYIYVYFRSSGPNARTISPPDWGRKIGGGDHENFTWAAGAACKDAL